MSNELAIISRVIDGSCADDDWTALYGLADADPTVLQRVVAALRVENGLRAVGDPLASLARRVAAPIAPASPLLRTRRMPRLVPWLGWAAAFCLLALWVCIPSPHHPVGLPEPDAAVEAHTSPIVAGITDAWREGRLLGTLPPVLIGTQTDARGVPEFIVVRQVVERSPTQGLSGLSVDELGRASFLPGMAQALLQTESM